MLNHPELEVCSEIPSVHPRGCLGLNGTSLFYPKLYILVLLDMGDQERSLYHSGLIHILVDDTKLLNDWRV